MSIFEAVILGIVQGLTEFLPVSSSGHLVLFSQFFQLQESSLIFEVIVHVGTLLAVLFVFWQEVVLLFKSFFKLLRNPKQIGKLIATDPGCRLLAGLVFATLPVVVLALIFKDQIERLFLSSFFVGLMLIVTGTILYVSHRFETRKKDLTDLSILDSLIIGIGQAAAVLPGLSRSGTTIAVGLFRGLERESAARFSFLLSIPAILGALVFSLGDLFKGSQVGAGPLLVGLLASAVTGYFVIQVLLDLVKKGKLIWFSYYTWFVGIVVVVLSFL